MGGGGSWDSRGILGIWLSGYRWVEGRVRKRKRYVGVGRGRIGRGGNEGGAMGF